MISLNQLGFDLYRIETGDGTDVSRLETGFRLADRYPLDIFVEENGGQFHIWDEGLTYHNLLLISPDLVKGARLHSIKDVVGTYGVQFTPEGSFDLYGHQDKAADLVSDYIAAMIGLDKWVLDIFSRKSRKTDLVESAMDLFKRWKPEAKITQNPKVIGVGGAQLEFDFSVDDDYVDVLPPIASSTAGFMRKAASFILSQTKGRPLGVVDDSDSSSNADTEVSLIATSYYAMKYSTLTENTGHYFGMA